MAMTQSHTQSTRERRRERMEWMYGQRRGPEWKQGWRSRAIGSVSAPSLHLIAVFAIVVLFLWLSQYTSHKSRLRHASASFQIFLSLAPISLLLLCIYYASLGRGGFVGSLLRCSGDGSSPWTVAMFLFVVLVLVSFQSMFHSKWFGPLD